MRAAYDFGDLPSFLAQYYEGMSVLLVEEDFYDLTMAYFDRVAGTVVETFLNGISAGDEDSTAIDKETTDGVD